MFWNKFIKLCIERDTTPTTACKAMGLSNATATKWKSGSKPNAITLQRIADYFGVSPSVLLDEQTGKGVKIPVYGSVPAGLPIEAIENILDYEEITPELANTGEFMSLRIKGDSMLPDIMDGDGELIRISTAEADTESLCCLVAYIIEWCFAHKKYEFHCCSRFAECSDAKQCVNPSRELMLECAYASTLAQGKIFYGKNRNV